MCSRIVGSPSPLTWGLFASLLCSLPLPGMSYMYSFLWHITLVNILITKGTEFSCLRIYKERGKSIEQSDVNLDIFSVIRYFLSHLPLSTPSLPCLLTMLISTCPPSIWYCQVVNLVLAWKSVLVHILVSLIQNHCLHSAVLVNLYGMMDLH